MIELKEADVARFWVKVQKPSVAECWEWTAAKDSNGYGQFTVQRRAYRAHRLALALVGRDIPCGMVVDHVCRKRDCVNPAHLRVVTPLINVHENSAAPGHLNALKTQCPRGHSYSGENLITRKSGRRSCRACANQQQRDRRARNSAVGRVSTFA